MDLKGLRSKGAFVSAALVKKEVTWKHADPETGDEHEDTFSVFVRRHSFGTVERVFSGGDDRSKAAALIAESVRFGEKGKEVMSYEDAYQLDPGLAAVFVAAINDVNGLSRGEAKNSPPPTNSGTN